MICWEDMYGSSSGVNEVTQGPRVKAEQVEQEEAKNWLREIELEVEAQGREWMRQRLQERLQAEADRVGSVFPPKRTEGSAPADGVVEPADGGGSASGQGLVWHRPQHGAVG